MNNKTIKKIQEIVGAKHLATAREDLMCYSYDATGMEYLPHAVAFPFDTNRWLLRLRGGKNPEERHNGHRFSDFFANPDPGGVLS